EEGLKYHLHLHQFYNIYTDLGKKEQDFILFHYFLMTIEKPARKEVWKDDPILAEFCEPMLTLICFLRKLRKFIVGQFSQTNLEKSQEIKFFTGAKKDLIEMRMFLIEPPWPSESIREEVWESFVKTSNTLNFIHQRFGSEYMKEPEFRENDKDIEDFEVKNKLIFLLQNTTIWSYSLLYYSHYAEKFMSKGDNHEVPTNVRKAIGMVYWNKLEENAYAYQKLKSEQIKMNPLWEERISAFKFHKNILFVHDEMIRGLPSVYEKFQSLVDSDSYER
ncbi:hypothetical protein PGT21_018852, partial [Puccinia graminis f. sp. tritici]